MYYFNKPRISPVGIKINMIESEEIKPDKGANTPTKVFFSVFSDYYLFEHETNKLTIEFIKNLFSIVLRIIHENKARF